MADKRDSSTLSFSSLFHFFAIIAKIIIKRINNPVIFYKTRCFISPHPVRYTTITTIRNRYAKTKKGSQVSLYETMTKKVHPKKRQIILSNNIPSLLSNYLLLYFIHPNKEILKRLGVFITFWIRD